MIVATLSIVPDAYADSWYFEPKRTSDVHEFGDVKIELVCDARKNSRWPLFELMIYKNDELQAKYRNVAFDQIFASDDNEFFLGVSNSGVPETAFVIFGSNGRLLREVKQTFLMVNIQSQFVTINKR